MDMKTPSTPRNLNPEEAAERFARSSQSIYTDRAERVAMRCALGDAAHLCDVLADAIMAENRGYAGKGPTTKLGRELAAMAKRCGDAIWAMRDKIETDAATLSQETS